MIFTVVSCVHHTTQSEVLVKIPVNWCCVKLVSIAAAVMVTLFHVVLVGVLCVRWADVPTPWLCAGDTGDREELLTLRSVSKGRCTSLLLSRGLSDPCGSSFTSLSPPYCLCALNTWISVIQTDCRRATHISGAPRSLFMDTSLSPNKCQPALFIPMADIGRR